MAEFTTFRNRAALRRGSSLVRRYKADLPAPMGVTDLEALGLLMTDLAAYCKVEGLPFLGAAVVAQHDVNVREVRSTMSRLPFPER